MGIRKVIMVCPYCGSKEFVRGALTHKTVHDPKRPLSTYYTVQAQICKRCGSIVREFIADPEKFEEY